MFPVFKFNETEILLFALVTIRIIAFLLTWPVFSVFSVPQPAKILLAIVLAICLFPVVQKSGISLASLSTEIMWLAAKEAAVGVCLGFFCRLFFFAISVAGNMIAMSTGLASAQMFNPSLNMQSTTIEQFYMTIATLLFLVVNGHHYFLTGLASSFDSIPISLQGANLAHFQNMGDVVGKVVWSGFQVASPVVVAIFFMNIAMGLLGRVVPQINVLVTSLPVNVSTGFLVMILMMPLLMSQLDQLMVTMTNQLFELMKQM